MKVDDIKKEIANKGGLFFSFVFFEKQSTRDGKEVLNLAVTKPKQNTRACMAQE